MVEIGERPLPLRNIKSTVRSSGSFICSDLYKNLRLREARAGFSSQRGAAIETRRGGGVSTSKTKMLPVFSSGVLCLETFFCFLKKLN